ncbi:hypothetical protein ACFLZJ_00465 [Nanoarchaeota archaeon]
MKKRYLYPKNKEYFKELIPFAQGIIKLLQKNKIYPVIHGSFAHLYYTKDKEIKVNDIDIMVQRKDFHNIIKLLEDNNIKFKYYPEYEILIIKKGKLKVEVDMPGGYKTLKDKSLLKVTKRINFYGVKVKMLTLEQLEDVYIVAYNRSADDKAKIKKKIKHFEKFLGRKLK